LEQFGLIQYFDHVQGTDGFPCKPAPDVVLTVLAALGAQPDECLFVGDSPADMEADRRHRRGWPNSNAFHLLGGLGGALASWRETSHSAAFQNPENLRAILFRQPCSHAWYFEQFAHRGRFIRRDGL